MKMRNSLKNIIVFILSLLLFLCASNNYSRENCDITKLSDSNLASISFLQPSQPA